MRRSKPISTGLDQFPRLFLGTSTRKTLALCMSVLMSSCSIPHSGPPHNVTPPNIIEIVPNDGQDEVSVSNSILVTFSQPMDTSSVQNAFSLSDGIIAVSGSFSWFENTMTFHPINDLSYKTTYCVKVTTSAQDTSGNPLASEFSSSFTTAEVPDTTLPSIVGVNPVDAAADVMITADVSAQFSEPMDTASVQNAFSLSDGVIAVSGSFSWFENTMTFHPTIGLSYKTTYYVKVTTSARDTSGNPLASEFNSNFTTLARGYLVPSFGSEGVIQFNPSSYDEAPADIVIDSVALYIIGSDQSPGGPQWRIEKRSIADGVLVSGFGNGGVLTSNPSLGYDAAIGGVSDGIYLYVVGYDMVPAFGDYEWRIEKRDLAAGALVATFGANGVITSNPSAGQDIPSAVARDGTCLYIVGFDLSSGEVQYRIEKRTMDNGALVNDFGIGGVAMTTMTARSVVVSSGSLYVIGWESSLYGDLGRIEKRSLNTGELITEFGSGGFVSFASASYTHPSTQAVAAVSDAGDLYVVGSGRENSWPDWQWHLEKLSQDTGVLVAGFGIGGIITSNPSMDCDKPYSLVHDEAYLYIVGFDDTLPGFDPQWRIEKRSMSTGELATDFGADGAITSNPSNNSGGYDEAARAVVCDEAYLYVVGVDYSSGSSNGQWRIEKRFK